MLDSAGQVLRKLRGKYRQRFGYAPRRDITVHLYRGYRSTERLFVQGRVLEDRGIEVTENDRRWKNFVNAIRRFESNEVAGAVVQMEYLGDTWEVMADGEGYIELDVPLTKASTPDPWEIVTATILEVPHGKATKQKFKGEIADLDTSADYAIVTDIDDTILKTHVTSLFKLRALYHTMIDNAHSRIAFAGAPELYQQLSEGDGNMDKHNPTFYLSRSPWNLYDMLEHFLDVKGFPKGPIFLRDVGLSYKPVPDEYGHKEGSIRRLIEHFPTLKFVLIGDSGELDADIYSNVAREFPDRIKAIIIRNVKNNANAHRIQRMFERRTPQQHWYLVADTKEARQVLQNINVISDS